MSGEDAPRPCLENLIVLEIKTNKQIGAKITKLQLPPSDEAPDPPLDDSPLDWGSYY
jgi:hypothetical protein